MNDLEKVFFSELKDMYDAEHQITKALPEMVEHASSAELKNAFRHHLEESKVHFQRLETVFREIGQEAKRKTCKGIEGVIDDGQLMAGEFANNSAIDAALIAAAQKVEHYEIASYGTLCSWAEELGLTRALSVLKENLAEEKQTDQKLTRLGESLRNPEAARHDTEKKSETAAKLGKMVGVS